MEITFIEYNPVQESVRVRIGDPQKEQSRLDTFTVSAYKELVEKDSPDYSTELRRIRKAFIEKGGMEWLLKEIQSYLKKQMSGAD